MRTIGILVLTAALLAAGSSDADEAASKGKLGGCFFVRDFQSWKAPPDAKSIVIRVGLKRYFRLDLSSSCPALRWPDARLITVFHSTTSVCDALDWNITVSQGPIGGIKEPCIVKRMTELSPLEVASIPRKERP
jgi:hypothetical protein